MNTYTEYRYFFMSNPRDELLKRIQEARKRVDKRVDEKEKEKPEFQTSTTAIDSLIVTLLDDSQATHRRNAILDLIKIKENIDSSSKTRISSFIIKALEHEVEETVRPYIISGIGEYFEYISNYIDVLHNILLTDKGTASRSAAAAILGRVKSKESVSILEKILLEDKSEDVRFEAKLALDMILAR